MNAKPEDKNALPLDDLAWDAYRFVAGEMTADELAAFQSRLESDVAAAEAVARAVEWGEVLAEALRPASLEGARRATRPPTATRETTAWRALGWMALGAAAASIFFALAAPSLFDERTDLPSDLESIASPERLAPRNVVRTPGSSDLAGAWQEFQSQGTFTAPTASWRSDGASESSREPFPRLATGTSLSDLPTWVDGLSQPKDATSQPSGPAIDEKRKSS